MSPIEAFSMPPKSRTMTARMVFSLLLRAGALLLEAHRLRHQAAVLDVSHDVDLADLAVGGEWNVVEDQNKLRHVVLRQSRVIQMRKQRVRGQRLSRAQHDREAHLFAQS